MNRALRSLLAILGLAALSLGSGWSKTPVQLELDVALPAAQHATPIPARFFLGYRPTDDKTDERLCTHLRDHPLDEKEIGRLHDRGAVYWRVLEIRSGEIRLAGEPVLTMDQGRIAEEHLGGLIIHPLYDQLGEIVDGEKALASRCGLPYAKKPLFPPVAVDPSDRPWGQYLLAIEPGVPWTTLLQVLYTLGQGQIGVFHLLVDDDAPTPGQARDLESPDARLVTVVIEPETLKVIAADSLAAQGPELAELTEQVLLAPPSCAIVSPAGSVTFERIVQVNDQLLGMGVSQVTAAGMSVNEEPSLGATAPAVTPIPRTWQLQEPLATMRWELPAIGEPRDPAEVPSSECMVEGSFDIYVEPALIEGPASLEPYHGQLRYCAERHHAEGTLGIQVQVEDGRVLQAQVEGPEAWAACVQERTVLWRFDEDGLLSATVTPGDRRARLDEALRPSRMSVD